jgi:hypothetical protein
MSIQVNNTDNQLNIIVNGVLDVYNVKTIKSVSRAVDASGNHYMSINFIANDKNNSVRIPLSEVTSPVTWTNDTAGAIAAVEDIRDWLSEVIDVEISEANDSILVYGFDGTTNRKIKTDANGELQVDILSLPNEGQQAMANSISVALASDQLGIARTTGLLRPTGATAIGNVNTVPASGRIYSVSVANVGAANGSVLGGASNIKPGEVLNFSADAVNNYFTSFAYDATGTEFIIIFVY